MSTATLKRQFITDADGQPVAVILPIEEYARVKDILEGEYRPDEDIRKVELIEKAAKDSLFLADLREVMDDFEQIDSDWWEISE